MSDTTGWKMEEWYQHEYYHKTIAMKRYEIVFRPWGYDLMGKTYHCLDDAKRAAHDHARSKT